MLAAAAGVAVAPGYAGAAPPRASHRTASVAAVPATTTVAPASTAVAPASTAVAPDAAAAAAVTVDLTSVTPAVATSREPVRVTATVRNGTEAPVVAGQARLVLGGTPVGTAAQVTAWAQDREPVTGTVLATAPLPATLAPGATARITLEVRRPASRSSRAYGVLPVSVEAAGAAVRTFVGFQRVKQYEPLRTAWLLPVTLPPDPALWGSDAQARARAWAAAVGEGGPVDRLLAAATESGLTVAVDPDLLTSAATAAPVTAATATPSPSPEPAGSGSAVQPAVALSDAEATVRSAAAARTTVLLRGRDALVLPVADTDVAAAAGVPDLQVRATTLVAGAAAPATTVGGVTGVALPADATWSPALATAYTRLYAGTPAAVVLPQSAVAGSAGGSRAARRSTSGVPLLLSSPGMSALVAPGSRTDTATEAAQELLAQSLVVLSEAPGVSRTALVAAPRGLVAEPAALRTLLAAVRSAPWLEPAEVGDLLDEAAAAPATATPATETPATETPATATPATATPATATPATETPATETPATETPDAAAAGGAATPLNAGTAAGLGVLAERAAAAASIRVDGTTLQQRWTATLDALTSTRWRGRAPAWRTLREDLVTEVSDTASGVRVAPQTINFIADRGRVQLTVVNDLDVDVSGLTVRLSPQNPRLRIDTQPDPVRIGAGSRTTVTFDATALAAGQVPIVATLTGPTGASVGSATTVQVRVSPTGSGIYWVLGGLAALALALGLWRSGRRRRVLAAAHRVPTVPGAVRLDEEGPVLVNEHDGHDGRWAEEQPR
ncbi:MAG TPA: DUF6049 family protein [Dermatophilaceae bacterium]|nr:DUF6049 family protein [Dermatophilaceae bacterium]